MTASIPRALPFLVMILALSGCGDNSKIEQGADTGPTPKLVAPTERFVPTVNIAPARGWTDGMKPQPVLGLSVTRFATGLEHPRSILVLPNGDVLVAETNAPPRKDEGTGLRGWIMSAVMKRAGAGVESPNRITLLRDADHDGAAETKSVFLEHLNAPFGMALTGQDFFVANTDAIVQYPYTSGALKIESDGKKLAELPGGDLNHHWTKSLLASEDGQSLFVGVGSNSNVAENGIEQEADRASILRVDAKSGATESFATGLRNPVGMSWEPASKALWVVVNERDELGSDLVPDYLTSVKQGGFYGWPYSYYGQHVDTRVHPQRPDLVSTAIVPDYALGAHTASLGLTFNAPSTWPQKYRSGAFVAQHGSWNREPLAGYKVVFIPFRDGKPDGKMEDILTGFVNDAGEANGRPVSVAFDKTGALLVVDDVGNSVWRVTPNDVTSTR